MKNLIRPGMTTEEHIQELENTTIDEFIRVLGPVKE